MAWICPKCETYNEDDGNPCKVCNSAYKKSESLKKSSPKKETKEKFIKLMKAIFARPEE